MDKPVDAGNVDFSGLILGLSSAALYYIGHGKIEGKPAAELNLPLAKQNIEIIELLETKTAGNLAPGEEQLLQQVLSDLRSKYAEVAAT